MEYNFIPHKNKYLYHYYIVYHFFKINIYKTFVCSQYIDTGNYNDTFFIQALQFFNFFHFYIVFFKSTIYILRVVINYKSFSI